MEGQSWPSLNFSVFDISRALSDYVGYTELNAIAYSDRMAEQYS